MCILVGTTPAVAFFRTIELICSHLDEEHRPELWPCLRLAQCPVAGQMRPFASDDGVSYAHEQHASQKRQELVAAQQQEGCRKSKNIFAWEAQMVGNEDMFSNYKTYNIWWCLDFGRMLEIVADYINTDAAPWLQESALLWKWKCNVFYSIKFAFFIKACRTLWTRTPDFVVIISVICNQFFIQSCILLTKNLDKLRFV